MRIDLHSHSHYSDGTASPSEVVRRAHAAGVEVLALTDHDSVSGFEEAAAEAKTLGIRLICGIEINTCEEDSLHILGYKIDPTSARLLDLLSEFRQRRQRRMEKIIAKLRDAKVDVAMEDVAGVSKQSLGRPHVADAMMRKSIVRSRKEAFERFLMKGKVGYVEPMGPTAEESIAAIKAAGGWASVAHPGPLDNETKLKRWVGYGLEGIEAYYPGYAPNTINRLVGLANRHNLLPTGGSDFHGPGSGRDEIGVVKFSDAHGARVLERL